MLVTPIHVTPPSLSPLPPPPPATSASTIPQNDDHSNNQSDNVLTAVGDCNSVGDVLRLMDGLGLLSEDDFIVCSGDLIGNADLTNALHQHRARRQWDKSCIMTMVLRELPPGHPSRSWCESGVYVLNRDPLAILTSSKTPQIQGFVGGDGGDCVWYEVIESEAEKRSIKLDSSLVQSHTALDIRFDLHDCHLDICSLNVQKLTFLFLLIPSPSMQHNFENWFVCLLGAGAFHRKFRLARHPERFSKGHLGHS